MKSIKRMVLTGAAVMVMMSFAAPAMASDYGADEGCFTLVWTVCEPPVSGIGLGQSGWGPDYPTGGGFWTS